MDPKRGKGCLKGDLLNVIQEEESYMKEINPLKNFTPFHLAKRWALRRLPRGKRVRLRDGVYRWIKEREWILDRIDHEGVHLLHDTRAYGLIVRMEDIHWGGFEKRFDANGQNLSCSGGKIKQQRGGKDE